MSYWMAVRRRLAAAALAGIDVAALAITYTGNMTDEIVTMGDGNQYRLLTLTSSGTLSIPAKVKADVWLCGGGANGLSNGDGGGGGYINSATAQSIKNVVAVVGAASGASSFGSITANGGSGKNGGSGGGGGYYNSGGTGAGVTTYPFSDTTHFPGKPHCAGGGGGGSYSYYEERDDAGKDAYACGDGGDGGTNGGSGSAGDTSRSYWPSASYAGGGKGGTYGGGNGAYWNYSYSYSTNATAYGGGGGGAVDADGSPKKAGSGYQGVIYVRIPLNQKEAA